MGIATTVTRTVTVIRMATGTAMTTPIRTATTTIMTMRTDTGMGTDIPTTTGTTTTTRPTRTPTTRWGRRACGGI